MKLKTALKRLTVLLCILTAALTVCGCSVTYDIPDTSSDNGSYTDELEFEDVVSDSNEINSDSLSSSETFSSETLQSDFTFRNDKLLNDHFTKHNEDFGYSTTEEYVQGANRVISDPNSLHKLEAEDGDDVYYLEETNEFVVVSTDGYIRTYFKPSRGIDYYNKQ